MMDVEMGEIKMEDDRAAIRDEVDELDSVVKEKTRESGKHRSRDRKKGRQEEDKDHEHRERERSKEREYEELVGRDSDRFDLRDRYESGRERKKEERLAEYGKDREQEKERDREKERSRGDRHREKDYDRDKYKEKERDKVRGKEHDRERERSAEWEHDRGRDRGKDRGKEHENDRETERERDAMREYDRGKERDRDKNKVHERENEKGMQKEFERERKEREREREKGKDKAKEKEKDMFRSKDSEREKEKSRHREREKDKLKDKERNKESDKTNERHREKERGRSLEADEDLSRTRDRIRETGGAKESEKDERKKTDLGDDRVLARKGESTNDREIHEKVGSENHRNEKLEGSPLNSELQERVAKMKEERMKKKSEGALEILSWVSKSRKLEEKRIAEKQAMHLSKPMEEQDDMSEESDDDVARHSQKDLAGVKILHGLDKVIEGGAVVLTLKDQSILAGGDINEEADMLENVEIGEQKLRDEAYRAAKKRTGLYDDNFNDDMGPQRTILPQYDDPVEDEGVELDESGQFTGEAEKKLEELRKRIEGSSGQRGFDDLTVSGRASSDFYTPEEMLQFKKPKKKKALRKKEKLDLDALEAEALSAGLGAGDLGSRNDVKRQTAKEEREKAEAEMRSNAYQVAYAKAEEASKVLRMEQTLTVKSEEDENLIFGDDYEDLHKSLEQARKLALKKQDEAAISGPHAVALLAMAKKEQDGNEGGSAGEPQEEKVVITEMEEFVLGLQLSEDTQIPEGEDVFMDEEDVLGLTEPEMKVEAGGWTEAKETNMTEVDTEEEKEDATPDEIIHEVAVGKGLAGALKLLKDRGTLKETIDWGGRNMDKKKSKLVGLYDNDGQKEIRIERTDEFGRILTPKEAFRMLSHKFHGKGPGKMKQEKRMKQYQEDLKTKQMKASDTPLLAMEKMREAQAQLKAPYLVLSGHVKTGQANDPTSGFATVEKDHLGSLTPMLGNKKVEYLMGIKRKPEAGSMGPPPPKKQNS